MGMEGIQQPDDLVFKINQAFEKLGVNARWKKAPKIPEGCESLKDKTIVMVDDMIGVLEQFAPYLIVATEGKTSLIHYKSQSLEQLVDQILENNPNLVLMDYNLSESLKGSDVIKVLKEKSYEGDSFGFSSDPDTTRDFEEAGATGSVKKEAGFPQSIIQELSSKIA